MTSEEAINKWIIPAIKNTWNEKKCKEILEALEHVTALDKIRAEIEHTIFYTRDSTDYDESLYNGAYRNGLYKALDIINKYKAESEE